MTSQLHHRRKRKNPRSQRRTQPGAAPGTLSTAPDTPRPAIDLIAFNRDRIVEQRAVDIKHLETLAGPSTVRWLNVVGPGDSETMQQVGHLFGLHALALEDVIHVHQRAKVEAYSDHLFIVTRLMALAGTEHLESEQISIFLGKDYVLTFQQQPGDWFEPVRERIRSGRGRLREAGADYLAYALIDAVIDSYFPAVDQFADRLDELETEVMGQESPRVIDRIHEVRNELLLLRRSVRPHRDALNELVRDGHPLIAAETRVFLRDCYDHTIQLIDLLEVYRDVCADLRDYHLSITSNRMNEVMKVLTIIATIFIPLSFIAALYGMNFNTAIRGNMPELNWPYGYLGVVAVMAAVAGAMLAYFYRLGWIGPTQRRRSR